MEKSSFFNSVGGDRKYKAEEWAAYFASFIGNGVFPVPSSGLQVVSGTGMNVVLRTGKAWINGYFYINDGDLTIPLSTAEGILKRIDRVVIRWDLTERTIRAIVKKSVPSSHPTAPTLQRDADAYELCIADILVNAGVTSVSQANITDRRFDNNLCGIVAGVVQQIDPSALTAQFDNFFELYRQLITQQYGEYNGQIATLERKANEDYSLYNSMLIGWEEAYKQEFEEWFVGIRGQLSGDIAGQLALEVNDLKMRVDSLEEEISNVPMFTMAAWLGNSYSGSAYLSTT